MGITAVCWYLCKCSSGMFRGLHTSSVWCWADFSRVCTSTNTSPSSVLRPSFLSSWPSIPDSLIVMFSVNTQLRDRRPWNCRGDLISAFSLFYFYIWAACCRQFHMLDVLFLIPCNQPFQWSILYPQIRRMSSHHFQVLNYFDFLP